MKVEPQDRVAVMIGPLRDLRPGISFDVRMDTRITWLRISGIQGVWIVEWPASTEPQTLRRGVEVLVQAVNGAER